MATKKPSAAQLRARANFIKMVKERARLRAAGQLPPTAPRKAKAAKKKRVSAPPSPAQLAARAKFVAMVKAKSKGTKKNKRLFPRSKPLPGARPLVSPPGRASALKIDKQLRAQQAWDKAAKKKNPRKRNPAILRLTEAQAKAYGSKIKGLSSPAPVRQAAQTSIRRAVPVARKSATKRKKTFKKVGIFGGSGFLGLGRSVQRIKRNSKKKNGRGFGTSGPSWMSSRSKVKRFARSRKGASKVKGFFGIKTKTRSRQGSAVFDRFNPAPAKVFSEFRGKEVARSKKVSAATGTPSTLAELGKLKELKLRGKTLKFRAGHLAADGRKKLHIVGVKLKYRGNPEGAEIDAGEIISVTYEADKGHIEPGVFNYVHKFGEDGGVRPHLVVDPEGYAKIEGGSYTINADGIID